MLTATKATHMLLFAALGITYPLTRKDLYAAY
jgi:hypothetical protein